MTNNNLNNNTISVAQWNCNSIVKKQLLLEQYMLKTKISIIGLNETKLHNKSKINFTNYQIHRRDFKSHSGGIAILTRSDLECQPIRPMYKFKTQIIGINVKLKINSINIFCAYIPPISKRNKQEIDLILEEIDLIFQEMDNHKPYILLGDLNAHSKSWYCKDDNRQGRILKNTIENHNCNIINNSSPTHYNSVNNSIIDLIIISSDLNLKLNYFTVKDDDLTSDHQLIMANFNLELKNSNFSGNFVKIKKINWELYSQKIVSILDSHNLEQFSTLTPDEQLKAQYDLLTTSIHTAASEATEIKTRKVRAKTLPNYLVMIINERKLAQKIYRINKDPGLKKHINFLTNIVKKELIAFKESIWLNFCKNTDSLQKNSKQYWDKIKTIGNLNYNKKAKTSLPMILHNNIEYSSDIEKANLFGNILKNTFSDPNKDFFDSDHKLTIEEHIKANESNLFVTRHADRSLDCKLSLQELEDGLSEVNKQSAPGHDLICYKHYIFLPEQAKILLLSILNLSWQNQIIPDDWKTAEVKMIRKKPTDPHDANNYRPISKTFCIMKILEKLVLTRLNYFLDKYKILSIYQSGFRQNRQTNDNLFYFCQKTFDNFHENKQIQCGIVFDIAKAFDTVWHDGLIFKLSQNNLPEKMGNWIKEFLNNRKFFIKINEAKSEKFSISAGTPQGSTLSATLFSIYINDIIELNNYPNNKVKSLLYADDLFAIYSDHNINYLKIGFQRYLNSLELWLNKWRLCIAAQKCSYNFYTKKKLPDSVRNGSFDLRMMGESIPFDAHPKYLGVTLDKNCNFNGHVNNIIEKCNKLTNIFKSLYFKDWALDTKSQLNIYKALVRSNMEYAAPVLMMSDHNLDRLNKMQNKALRMIYKQPLDTTSKRLQELSSLQAMNQRIKNLAKNYLRKAINVKNPLIYELTENESTHEQNHKCPLNILNAYSMNNNPRQ